MYLKIQGYFLNLNLLTKAKENSLGPEVASGYKLYLDKLQFSYDSFDRIVINGYLLRFHKATNVLYYFKEILGHRFINKKLLFSVTEKYKRKINDIVDHQKLYCEYIDMGKRKEDFVYKYLRQYEKKDQFGLYCILKARENEQSLRVV